MNELILYRARERLSRALVSWQLGAIGLLALAVAVNMGMMARITSLQQAREADAARYNSIYTGTPTSLVDFSINYSKLSLKVGEVVKLTATPIPADATAWQSTPGVEWYSNDASAELYKDEACTQAYDKNTDGYAESVYLKGISQKKWLTVGGERTISGGTPTVRQITVAVTDAEGNYLLERLAFPDVTLAPGESVIVDIASYSRDMSMKTKSAKHAKMQRGEYQSKICPYGYRKSDDGRMEPDPEAAAVVQLIYELAASGTSAAEIARELFRRGIPTPGEYKAAHGNHTHDISRTHGIWCSSTVLRILEDERYIGSYVIGKRAVIEVGGSRSRMKDREKWHIIPDHHPAIIDKALFEQVQATQRRFSQPHKVKHDYPLKGIVFCGCCGHALSRTTQKTARYICRHSQADESLDCHNAAYNAAKLEQAVLLLMKKQLEATLPVNPDGTIQLKAVVEERSAYEQQMDELLDCKQSLFEQYLMGEITLESYQVQKAIYDERLLLIKSAYAAVVAQAKKKQEELERRSSRQSAAKLLEDANADTENARDDDKSVAFSLLLPF